MKAKKQKLTQEVRDAFALAGRFGGRATFKKKGSAYMKAIGAAGAKKRWEKNKELKEITK